MRSLVGVLALPLAACAPNFDKQAFYESYFSESIQTVHRSSAYFFGGLGANTLARSANSLDVKYNLLHCRAIELDRWPDYLGLMANDAKNGEKLVFVAHSLGCREAVNAARVLDEFDVPVSLVLLDAIHFRIPPLGNSESRKIPKNVDVVHNYFTRDFFRGCELRSGDFESENTRVYNLEVDGGHCDFDDEFGFARYEASIVQCLGNAIDKK